MIARDILIPIALSILITFLLHPIVRRLRRIGIPNGLAVVITVILALGITSAIGWVVIQQAYQLVANIPDYRENLREKVRSFRTSDTGTFAKLTGTIEELKHELASPATQSTTAPTTAATPVVAPVEEAVKVQVVSEGPGAGQYAFDLLGPVMPALAALSIIILLVTFLLLYTEDLWERIIWLAGIRQISLTTSATDEVSTRIARYLRMQFVVNLVYGIMVWLGLMLFGVPNSLLWGVLGFLLRFAPYIGPSLAAILPILLTAAVFPGWSRVLGVATMFAVIELTTNMVLEPILYANSTGISTLGVVVAAVIWSWIWGPIGIVLAVPITVCLVVIGKHVPMLAIFHHLFGTESRVPEVARLYQRLMVDDDLGAEELITERLETVTPTVLCDELLLPVLRELKHDLAAGMIEPAHVRRAVNSLEVTIGNDAAAAAEHPLLVCIAAQNEVDYAAARLLVYAAASEGVPAIALSSDLLASEVATKIGETGAGYAAIVQVAPVSVSHSRRLFKSLAGRLSNSAKIVDVSIDPGRQMRSSADGAETRSVGDLRLEQSFGPLVARLKEQASMVSTAVTSATQSPAVA
ncbi:MAG: AI-2E family transporter [Burkholderiales bacterium]|nr:AI-2E family transporter [Phycisphaerae bacterium]